MNEQNSIYLMEQKKKKKKKIQIANVLLIALLP